MEIQTNLCANALRKAALLITKASDLEMDISGYGEIAENPYNGNVYLWLEDYQFTLFIPLSANDRIHACWSNPYASEEEITDAHDMTLHDLETWSSQLNEKAESEDA